MTLVTNNESNVSKNYDHHHHDHHHHACQQGVFTGMKNAAVVVRGSGVWRARAGHFWDQSPEPKRAHVLSR